jgi:hypothetical protein
VAFELNETELLLRGDRSSGRTNIGVCTWRAITETGAGLNAAAGYTGIAMVSRETMEKADMFHVKRAHVDPSG